MKPELKTKVAKISLVTFVILLLLTLVFTPLGGFQIIEFVIVATTLIPALVLGLEIQRWFAGAGMIIVLLLIMFDHTSGQKRQSRVVQARINNDSKIITELTSQRKKHEDKEQARQETVFKPGFMYWTAPYLLSADWAAVITGTVVNVEKYNPKSYLTLYKGKIKIHQILFSKPTKKVNFVKTDYLACDGGFKGLKVGDKVMIFLIEYEDGYAIADYVGGTCQLGLKLSSFKAPIVLAVKDRLKTGHISKKHQKLWRDVKPKAFDAYMTQVKVPKKP